jgi:hypothetical protein
VYRDSVTGNCHVPAEIQVPGSHVTLTHALVGYCVTEYGAGLDADPTYLPWVDNYITTLLTVSCQSILSRTCPPRRTCHPTRPCQPNAARSHAVDKVPALRMILDRSHRAGQAPFPPVRALCGACTLPASTQERAPVAAKAKYLVMCWKLPPVT